MLLVSCEFNNYLHYKKEYELTIKLTSLCPKSKSHNLTNFNKKMLKKLTFRTA